jgi:hypothetical protein
LSRITDDFLDLLAILYKIAQDSLESMIIECRQVVPEEPFSRQKVLKLPGRRADNLAREK